MNVIAKPLLLIVGLVALVFAIRMNSGLDRGGHVGRDGTTIDGVRTISDVSVGDTRREVEAFLESEGISFSYLNRHIAARKKIRDFIFMHTHLAYSIEFDEDDVVVSVNKRNVNTSL